MRRCIHWILLSIACFGLIGCSEVEHVGGGYVLVTPPKMGPDHHPGTSLERGHKVIWGNVYVSAFYPHPARLFLQDGIFLFVGPLPSEAPSGTYWAPYSQLFAVRADGPPVILTERIAGISPSASAPVVCALTLTNGAFEIYFEHAGHRRVTSAELKQLLDEADTSGRLVHNDLGTYRELPSR
jgi:hypothetical protein